jgi:hypothetical protein
VSDTHELAFGLENPTQRLQDKGDATRHDKRQRLFGALSAETSLDALVTAPAAGAKRSIGSEAARE